MSETLDQTLSLLRQVDFDPRVLEGRADELRPVLLAVARGEADDADEYMRKNAIALLGAVADESCVETLVDLVRHDRPEYRANAIRSLTAIDSDSAAQGLEARLAEPSFPATEGKIIVAALAKIGRASSVEAVRSFRKSFAEMKKTSPGIQRDLEQMDETIRKLESR